MGILNATPDSFYANSRGLDKDVVLNKVEQMVSEGVDWIDIGGYSSRPGAQFVSPEEEANRVYGVINWVHETFPDHPISIDTFRSSVAEAGIEAGASIINDISSGFLDERIFQIAAANKTPYIMMHMRGNPQTMMDNCDYENLVQEMIQFFQERISKAQQHGISDLIIDPGFGFSKTLDSNYELLSKLKLLNVLEKPLLVGLSRKSMIYKLLETSADLSLNGTSVLNTIALLNGATILRVHDVKEAVEAVKLIKKMDA